MNQIYTCKIDGKECKSQSELSVYLKKMYNLNFRSYYDLHVKKEDEGNCLFCGKETKYNGLRTGYRKYCSNKCSSRHIASVPELRKASVEKVKSTKLKRYGDSNYNNLEKMQQSCLEKYGKKYATQSTKVKNKTKKTNLKKYGVEHHTQCESIKIKAKNTNLSKYGVEYYTQTDEYKVKARNTVDEKYGGYTFASDELNAKVKNTMLERYGVESPLQSKEIKEKQQKTNINRYGGIVPTKSKDIVAKIKDTNIKRYGVENTFNLLTTKNTFLEKYGVTNPSQIPGVQEKIKETCLKKFGNEKFFASDYAKEKIKETCLKKYGVENAMHNEQIYTKCITSLSRKKYKLQSYITKWNHVVKYQSESELEFIKFCEEKDIFIQDGPRISYTHNNSNKIYYSDFLIEEKANFRIVEIKRKHKWWFQDLKTGVIKSKANAAIKYSKEHGYLPYKILFEMKV